MLMDFNMKNYTAANIADRGEVLVLPQSKNCDFKNRLPNEALHLFGRFRNRLKVHSVPDK